MCGLPAATTLAMQPRGDHQPNGCKTNMSVVELPPIHIISDRAGRVPQSSAAWRKARLALGPYVTSADVVIPESAPASGVVPTFCIYCSPNGRR